MHTLSQSRSIRAAALAVVAAALAGCVDSAAPPSTPHAVLVTTVHNLPAAEERSFTAVVRARYESELAFRTGGKVTARLVDVGQSVSAGSPIARLDPADHQLALRAAEDQLQAAKIDADQAASDSARLRRLLGEKLVSAADDERQRARTDAARARQAQAARALDLARNKLAYTILTAEFDGVVTAVRFEAGQVVAEGQPVVGVARPGELEVEADLPEELAAHAQRLIASASFRHGGIGSTTARLREIAPAAAPQTRTFRARFSLTDKVPDLRIGMTANLRLAEPGAEPLARLPATALLKTNGHATVWQLADDGRRLVAQPVEVVRFTDETVLVRGLTDGARVVCAGVQKLDAGVAVFPVERSGSGTVEDSRPHAAERGA